MSIIIVNLQDKRAVFWIFVAILKFSFESPSYYTAARAAELQVKGSIPDGVNGTFHWLNPSGRTVALGSTQPLTEMSKRNRSWAGGGGYILQP
jgi:hypothetical protein